MSESRCIALLAYGLVVTSVGCGSSSGAAASGAGATACRANATVSCTCGNGAQGTGVCSADGSRFGACSCPADAQDGGPDDAAALDVRTADADASSNDPCSSPECKPVWISSDPVTALVVDDTNIYAAGGFVASSDGGVGSLVKWPKAGGPPTTLAANLTGTSYLAVDSTHVYWASNAWLSTAGTIARVPIAGGEVSTLAAANEPQGFAVESGNVYWSDDTALKVVPASGGEVTTLVTMQGFVGGIAVANQRIYWEQNSTESPTFDTVDVIDLSGGTPEILSKCGLQFGEGILIQGTTIYFSAYFGGVQSVSTSGPSSPDAGLTTFLSLGSGALASDTQDLYVATSGYLVRAPLSGGLPSILLNANATALAVDATSIYWGGPQGIARVAK